MERVPERDVRRLLDLVADAAGAATRREFGEIVAGRVGELVGAELTSYTEVWPQPAPPFVVCAPTQPSQELQLAFGRCAHQHPLVMRPTADSARAETISDYLGGRAFRRLGLYAEVYRPLGAGDQLAINLTPVRETIVGIALNRPRATFSPRDRAMLELLRSPLVKAHARIVAHEEPGAGRPLASPTLSAREHEVVALVAEGLANAEVASRLSLSRRTVEDHLQHVYRRFGIANRTRLAALYLGGGLG